MEVLLTSGGGRQHWQCRIFLIFEKEVRGH